MVTEKEITISEKKYTIRLVTIKERSELENFSKRGYHTDMTEFAKNVDQWFFYQACIYGLVPPEGWETETVKGRKYIKEDELLKVDSADIVSLGLIIFMFQYLSDEDKKKLK